jgi:hypothetical protein
MIEQNSKEMDLWYHFFASPTFRFDSYFSLQHSLDPTLLLFYLNPDQVARDPYVG